MDRSVNQCTENAGKLHVGLVVAVLHKRECNDGALGITCLCGNIIVMPFGLAPASLLSVVVIFSNEVSGSKRNRRVGKQLVCNQTGQISYLLQFCDELSHALTRHQTCKNIIIIPTWSWSVAHFKRDCGALAYHPVVRWNWFPNYEVDILVHRLLL